jgi:hypothetical protein
MMIDLGGHNPTSREQYPDAKFRSPTQESSTFQIIEEIQKPPRLPKQRDARGRFVASSGSGSSSGETLLRAA